MGAAARWVTIGDVNFDGLPDLAVAQANGVSVLKNAGGSQFNPFSSPVQYSAGSDPYSVVIGDFNGDGTPDLAIANRGSNNVSILLGYGDATFQSAVNYRAGLNPVALSTADFNGDGRADLAVVNSGSNNVTILLGAAPTLSTVSLVAAPGTATLGQAITMTATVAPASATGKVTFYDGTTILGVSPLASGQASFTTRLLPSGRRSLTARYGGDAVYLKATSNLTSVNVNAVASVGFGAPVTYGGLNSPLQVASGDFNADGITDLAVLSNNGGVVSFSVFLGKGNGTFHPAVNYAAGIGSASSIVAADFNGDGKPDLMIGGSIFFGNGDGTFQTGVSGLPSVGVTSPPVIADFNGDGKADVAVNDDGVLKILLGTGDSTFLRPISTSVSVFTMIAGDFNGDSKADLAVLTENSVSVLLGNGDGTFQPAVNYALPLDPFALATGDLNGDGKPDLVVVTKIDVVSVLLGHGDGSFAAPVLYPLPARGSGQDIRIADINGDGKADVVIANSTGYSRTDGVIVMLGNGDGTLQAPTNYTVGLGPNALALGDFNGDGRTDLAVVDEGSYLVPNSYSMTILLGSSGVPPGPPFGSFDIPTNGQTGLVGDVQVGGWALGTPPVKVQIWRNPVTGENPAAIAPNGLVYIEDTIFVAGTRPDVAALYPNYPNGNDAGWGAQLLSNELANSSGHGALGNGTYTLHAIATDGNGLSTDVGAHVVRVNNAGSALPFGAIDTPAPGGTISGTVYVNFGWALTPGSASIPTDGPTIWVFIDNQPVGHPVYNNPRSDIQSLFPGYANTNGAVGYFFMNTTRLTNGIHQIAWSVTDNAGHTQGIGSRYFFVQN